MYFKKQKKLLEIQQSYEEIKKEKLTESEQEIDRELTKIRLEVKIAEIEQEMKELKENIKICKRKLTKLCKQGKKEKTKESLRKLLTYHPNSKQFASLVTKLTKRKQNTSLMLIDDDGFNA